MAVIHVPRPDPKTSMNPDRRVNALLQAQIQHLHEAERNLPLRHRTDVYINAIKTEGEAANYIRRVTEAIHGAHEDAAAKRGRGIAIAAAADEGPVGKPPTAGGGKKSAGKNKGKVKSGQKT